MLGAGIRDLLYRWLPKPRAGRATQFRPGRVERVLVLAKHPNPTFTYYLEERLPKLPVPVEVFSLGAPLAAVGPDGVFVIICRYIRPRQLLWLWRRRERLAGIALFIDDDLAATMVEQNGPLSYRLYLWGMGILPLAFLNGLLTHVWASTPQLAEALAHDGADIHLLGPYPPAAAWQPCMKKTASAAPSRLRIGFHATGAHFAEHRFLIPIMRIAMDRHPNLDFEVVASGHLAGAWRNSGIVAERMAIIAPRSWPDYLLETTDHSLDIFLVPLLPGRANNARADTKRIDACRMGAAAVFSRCAAYERHAATGEMLVPNTSECWTSAIAQLVNDADARAAVRHASLEALRKMQASNLWELPGMLPRDATGNVP